MTVDSFREAFPEFQAAHRTVITAKLALAQAEVDSTVWGDLEDSGVQYLLAHKLAQSPQGQKARLSASDGKTTYWMEYRRLQRIVYSDIQRCV